MIIDCHCHQITPGMLDRHPHWGPFLSPKGVKVGDWVLGTKQVELTQGIKWLESKLSAQSRLRLMDQTGTDHLILSVPSHFYMYWAGEFGDEYARITNDELYAFTNQAPERFSFWGHANLANPQGAAQELERAVQQLGAVGMSMGGVNFGGLEVYDEELDPVWRKLVELNVPIFIHGYNQSVTWGKNWTKEKYDTTAILGMNVDEATAFWYFINGGVLDRFPQLRVYITHAGGFAPFQLQRFNEVNKTMAPDSRNQKSVIEYLPNFYFDLDLHSRAMRRAMIEDIGVERLLYGTNFGGADSHHGDLCDDIGLTAAQKEQIHSTNALQLLHQLGKKKLGRANKTAAVA